MSGTTKPSELPTTRQSPPKSKFGRMSPVFLVDRIEPCLDFWVDRFGFEVRADIPEIRWPGLCADRSR